RTGLLQPAFEPCRLPLGEDAGAHVVRYRDATPSEHRQQGARLALDPSLGVSLGASLIPPLRPPLLPPLAAPPPPPPGMPLGMSLGMSLGTSLVVPHLPRLLPPLLPRALHGHDELLLLGRPARLLPEPVLQLYQNVLCRGTLGRVRGQRRQARDRVG